VKPPLTANDHDRIGPANPERRVVEGEIPEREKWENVESQ
jgi:hypothetical protein